MDFITLDFETATRHRDSACELGLTLVRQGQLETRTWLIQPPGNVYDYFNIQVHGIQPQETAQAPTFADIWPEVHPLLQGQLVLAHNAPFDMSVLRATLDTYGLPAADFLFSCSCRLAKNFWKGLPSYGLGPLCEHHRIPLQHHRAGADSHATAQLCLKLFSEAGVSQQEHIPQKLGMHLGRVWEGGYKASSNRK